MEALKSHDASALDLPQNLMRDRFLDRPSNDLFTQWSITLTDTQGKWVVHLCNFHVDRSFLTFKGGMNHLRLPIPCCCRGDWGV